MKIEPPTEPLPTTDENAVPPSTPQNVGIRVGGTDHTARLGSWESPAFSQRSRTSFGGLVDTPFDPFAEEDGFVPGKGRKRPRFSMRNSEWRVINEPESPGEKESPIDWMELDAEVSEPEVEDKGLAQDVKAAEIPAAGPPVQDARESSATAESHDAVPSIQLPSEPGETDHGQALEQLAKHATQSAEFPAGQVADSVTAEETLDHFVHPPTDTPRLHPIPSPGLPIPSPLVPTDSPNGYFASSATSTQTSHGRFLTAETQTTATKGEGVVGSQMEQVSVQEQPLSLETGVENQTRPSSEEFLAPKALDNDIQEPEPASMDEATEPLHPVNLEPKADAGLFSEDEEDEQSAEYSEKGSMVDERGESDVDQEYSEEDVAPAEEEISPQEGKLSDEGELEEVNEEEQGLPNQIPDSMGSHGKPQTEVINLDSDEAEKKNTDREHIDGGAEKGEAGPYSTMADDFNGHNHYPDDMEEDEEVDDDTDKERVESEAYEDSEDVENDYGSQNERPEGYEYNVGTDFESEDLSDEEHYQQPPPPKGDADVIVLDSDSDEEARPSSQGQPTEQSKHEYRGPQEPEPTGLADEYLSSADSATEKDLVPVDEGQAAEEQFEEDIVYEKAEDESVEDEVMENEAENENVDSESVDGAWDQPAAASIAGSASTTASQKEPTSFGQAGTHEETGQLQRSDLTTHEHNRSIERSPQQSDFDPESAADNVDMAIDPGLAGTDAENATPVAAVKQEMDHVEVRQVEPGQSPEASEPREQVHRPIWLDGAASPAPVPDSKAPTLLSTAEDQPMTPAEAQEADPNHQVFRDARLNGALPTPQYSQEAARESSLHDASITSNEPSSIEPGPRPSSIAVQKRVELVKAPVSEEDQELTGEASPPESERYFSPGEDGPAHSETGRDTSPAESGVYFSPTGPDPPRPPPLQRLAYTTFLATLADHPNELIDTTAVVCEVPATRATSEEMTVQITDPSLAGSTVPARFFRSYEDASFFALLRLKAGDVVLLRDFKVEHSNHSFMLGCVRSSSWFAFRDSEYMQEDGVPSGYNIEECDYVAELTQWYHDLGAAMVADSQLQVSIGRDSLGATPDSIGALSDEESLSSGFPSARDDSPSQPRSARRKRKPHRKITVHELRDGRRYAQVGSPSGRHGIHQLRDGTVYANL